MIRQGRELAAIDEHIIVKVPFTKEGVKACKALSSEGKKVNVTLVFSPTQALIAAKVGAYFVSPFVGRLDDIATSGMGLIREIVDIYENYQFKTRDSRRVRPPFHSHRRSRAHGRGHLHVSRGRHRWHVPAPADRHRSRTVPERLGEGTGSKGVGGHTQVSRRPGTAGGARRRRRSAAEAARGRQAHGARADRIPVRSGHVRGGRQARHPPLPGLRDGRTDRSRRRRGRRRRARGRPVRSTPSRRTLPYSAGRSRKPTPRRS